MMVQLLAMFENTSAGNVATAMVITVALMGVAMALLTLTRWVVCSCRARRARLIHLADSDKTCARAEIVREPDMYVVMGFDKTTRTAHPMACTDTPEMAQRVMHEMKETSDQLTSDVVFRVVRTMHPVEKP